MVRCEVISKERKLRNRATGSFKLSINNSLYSLDALLIYYPFECNVACDGKYD
jgi:hypothetical protein